MPYSTELKSVTNNLIKIPTELVWQQQMEYAHIQNYKLVQGDRPDPCYALDHTEYFDTQFKPLQLIEGYSPSYPYPEYGVSLYGDISLYYQQKLQFKCEEYPPTDEEDKEGSRQQSYLWLSLKSGSRMLKFTL